MYTISNNIHICFHFTSKVKQVIILLSVSFIQQCPLLEILFISQLFIKGLLCSRHFLEAEGPTGNKQSLSLPGLHILRVEEGMHK